MKMYQFCYIVYLIWLPLRMCFWLLFVFRGFCACVAIILTPSSRQQTKHAMRQAIHQRLFIFVQFTHSDHHQRQKMSLMDKNENCFWSTYSSHHTHTHMCVFPRQHLRKTKTSIWFYIILIIITITLNVFRNICWGKFLCWSDENENKH